MENKITAGFPFESKFIEILGSRIHYIDENDIQDSEQTTFVCVHGNPTSSYLWRNIIPFLKTEGRVVALDLVGFGKSDKPDIDYRVRAHAKYFNEFVNTLELNNIVFVLHDWGTALGLNYARENTHKIRGIIFMEGVVAPKKWDWGNFPIRLMFRAFRNKTIGKWMIIKHNFFTERVLLMLATKRTLNSEEKSYYRQPFLEESSRLPTYVFPNEIPINGKPADVHDMVKKNDYWLETSMTPKLLLWVKPGVLIKPTHVNDMNDRYPNLQTVFLGKSSKGLMKESHFVQEDFPNEIGNGIIKWYQALNQVSKQ